LKQVVPNHYVDNAHQAFRCDVVSVLRVLFALAIPLVNHRYEPADVQIMLDRLFVLGGLGLRCVFHTGGLMYNTTEKYTVGACQS